MTASHSARQRGPAVPEDEQFYWNCHVAAKIIDDVEFNTATRACALYAVRKASICYAGKNGVRYATPAAAKKRADTGRPWHKAGLVKEHVVPVSMIRERVVDQLAASRKDWGEAVVFGDDDAEGLSVRTTTLFRNDPRAWQVGRIVRDLTVLAWVTPEDERLFDDKARHGGISLRKRMPMGWDGVDYKARYSACGIALVELTRL